MRTGGARRITALPRGRKVHLGRMAPKSILGGRRRSESLVRLLVVGILRDDHKSRVQSKQRKWGSPRPQPPSPADKESSEPQPLVAGWSIMTREIAFDMGTSTTQVFEKGRGLVFNQPTVVTYDTKRSRVLSFGTQAIEQGRHAAGAIRTVRFVKAGSLDNLDVTRSALKFILKQLGIGHLTRSRSLIVIPASATPLERRALLEVSKEAGLKNVVLLEAPLAISLGQKGTSGDPIGSMTASFGGGRTEAAIVSLGGIASCGAKPIGGEALDDAIATAMRNLYGVALDSSTAEAIKVSIGSALPEYEADDAEVRARDAQTGSPKTVVIRAEEVREAMEDLLAQMISVVASCLSNAPAELSHDLAGNALMLAGGTSLLPGLATRLSTSVNMKVDLLPDPSLAVIRGAGRCLKNPRIFEKLAGS
jgi:rod shape-determining protein MreB